MVWDSSIVEDIFKQYSNYTSNHTYNCLYQTISSHPELLKWIANQIENNPNLLNLVTKDWISNLKKDPVFQEYMNNNVAHMKYSSKNNKIITNYRTLEYKNNINVIVIGTFKLIKPEKEENNIRLKLVDSIPLQCIADIMCLFLDKKVLHNATFFINNCNAKCIKCREHNINPSDNWCIQKSIVYRKNSTHLIFANRDYCESLFQIPTKAIVQLEINHCYSFGDNCKIGGNVEKIIFIEDILDENMCNIEGILKIDENFVPEENETIIGGKRKHEEASTEEEEEKASKQVKYDDGDNIIALPKGINYTKLQFDVTSSTKNMPDK